MSDDSSPTTVGSRLSQARQRRGISLKEIAHATKISVGVLEALERNDLSKLPGGIFTRSFVRSYAVAVGLDPEETIRDFMEQFPHEVVVAGHPTTVRQEDNDTFESNRRVASVFVMIAAISVPIVIAILYLVR